MAQDTLDDMLLRDAQIQSVQPMLWASLALALTALLGLLAKIPALAVVGWIGGWLAGPTALSRLAPALGTSPLLKYPLFLGCAMPGLSLGAPVYGLVASRTQRAALQNDLRQAEARERRREREALARAAAGGGAAAATEAGATPGARKEAAAAAAATPVRAAEALPVLRFVAEGIGDGAELQLRISRTSPDLEVPADAQLPPVRSSGGVFGVGYHVDAGTHWVSVDRQEMAEAGLSLDQLHRQALSNLMKLVKGKPGLRVIEDPAKASYSGLLLDGDHEACLVLLDALWDQALKSRTPNGAVVAIPSRDVLAFCDAHSEEGIAQVREAAARIKPEAQGALSQQLLLRRNGRWELFKG